VWRGLTLELKLAARGATVPLAIAALLGLGLFALAHGTTVIGRQQAAIAESPRLQIEEHRRVFAPLAPSASAGDQLYYLFFHTVREPSRWAPLAIGQRDVQAFNLKIRLLALQGQLYDVDLGNPLLASFGAFDLAFVLVVLVPLLVIALAGNVYAAEVEAGTWSLVRSQPVRVWRLLLLKYLIRAGCVLAPIVLLYVGATVWLGLPLDRTWWTVAAAILLYVLLWIGVAAGIGALRRSTDFNVLALLGVWVTWTALGPALVNVAAAARFPLPEALELTVLQRQGYHGAWDEPLPEVMEAFYGRYPEWRSIPVPGDRYSNAWYYAMQQRGDDAARQAAAAYRRGLEERDRWVARWSWLLPPAALQRLLTAAAGTDLRAYLAYLDSVSAYHEQLKAHFFPVIFHEKTIADVDWAGVPRHHHRDGSR
jgi:ABC-2 type transport system permease protein